MPPLSTWMSGYGPRREASAACVAAEAEGLQVAEVACAALVAGHDVVHLLPPLLEESIEALAAELQQLVALSVAELHLLIVQEGCARAEAFGYAAHEGVAALLDAGDSVVVEPLGPPPRALGARGGV